MTQAPRDGLPVPTAFPRNPDYGAGRFRRRIRIVRQGRAELAVVDDPQHAIWCRVHHDGETITAIEGGTLRAPNSNCPGAHAALQELVGMPLASDRAALFADGRALRNCTHQFDLAALAVENIRRAAPRRTYDIVIPDQTDAPVVAEVAVDGACVLRWRIAGACVLDIDPDGPVPLMRGFTRWAREHLAADMLEAALLLQRACLVADGRRWIIDRTPDLAITAMPELNGACFAYQPERVAHGVQSLGNTRDFSAAVDETDIAALPRIGARTWLRAKSYSR